MRSAMIERGRRVASIQAAPGFVRRGVGGVSRWSAARPRGYSLRAAARHRRKGAEMGYLIGVDIGGTFTDCIAIDEQGTVTIGKALSTGPDFAAGFLNS